MLSPSQKKRSGSAAAIARKIGCSASSWWRAQEPKARRNGAGACRRRVRPERRQAIAVCDAVDSQPVVIARRRREPAHGDAHREIGRGGRAHRVALFCVVANTGSVEYSTSTSNSPLARPQNVIESARRRRRPSGLPSVADSRAMRRRLRNGRSSAVASAEPEESAASERRAHCQACASAKRRRLR